MVITVKTNIFQNKPCLVVAGQHKKQKNKAETTG
jgi:hypothetical protein